MTTKRRNLSNRLPQLGFTIVELLIAVVTIAILAAISVVAYNGVQARARDADRLADFQAMQKSIEMYYVEKGAYPNHTSMMGNTVAAATWAKANLNGVSDEVLINPSAASGTVNSWSAGGSITTSSQYSYYALNSSLTVCTAAQQCTGGYRMAWRDESGVLHSANRN